MSVLIADPSPAMIGAVRALVDRDERLRFVGSARDAETLAALLQEMLPEVVVLDPSIFGRGAAECLARIAADHPATGIVLTDLLDADLRLAAPGLGTRPVVLSKLAGPEGWIEAILTAGRHPPRPVAGSSA